jgi:hypothetical protein
MHHRMIPPVARRWSGVAAVLLVLTAPVWAGPGGSKPGTDDGTMLIGTRTDKPDGSTAMTVGRRLPTAWETKVGIDFGLAAPLTTTPAPEAYLNGWAQSDRSSGIAWANIALPATSFGLDKAALEARVDPAHDQGNLATTLSRSVPIGDAARLILQQGYTFSEMLANPAAADTPSAIAAGSGALPSPSHTVTSEGQVSLTFPSSAITFSAGAKMSSTDDKWLRTLSAEQKLFGGPMSLTGAISERATGETDKSVKAAVKYAW